MDLGSPTATDPAVWRAASEVNVLGLPAMSGRWVASVAQVSEGKLARA